MGNDHFFLEENPSATGLFAIFVTTSTGGEQMYYSFKDHQGSLAAAVHGNTVERLVYDPATASFLSPDRYMQDPTSAQGFNRYAYCMNNPLRFIDPTGYYVTNLGVILITGQSIGDHLDSWMGKPIIDFNEP